MVDSRVGLSATPDHDGNRTRLEQISLPIRGIQMWTFVLNDVDAEAWDKERIEMLRDAFWLLRQALAGNTEGPLTLPLLGVKVRD